MNSGNKSCDGAPSSIPPGFTPEMKNKSLVLCPISPFTSGEGLPYAPINWPLPGYNWSWKVGRNIAVNGLYTDRYLCPPIYLQKPGRTKQVFSSKTSVERYIRTEFPGKDVDAFFASFKWYIPAKSQYCRIGKREKEDLSEVKIEPESSNIPRRKKGVKGEDKDWEGEGETSHTYARKRKQKPAPVPSRLRQQTREPFKRYFPSASKHEVVTIDLTEDTETSDSLPNDTDVLENEMIKSRMKLSSLLALEFPLLISTENLNELQYLLSMLQKDSRLSLDQRLKLQMIEEIPLNAKHFMETKKYMEDADNFLAGLEINMAKVSLNNKYNQSKEKAAQLQDEIDSRVLAMKELTYQIFQLQSQLADNVELKRAEKKDLVSVQVKAIDSLSSIAQKVELGKSQKQEWELKKAYAAKRMDDILAKYESLKGFSF